VTVVVKNGFDYLSLALENRPAEGGYRKPVADHWRNRCPFEARCGQQLTLMAGSNGRVLILRGKRHGQGTGGARPARVESAGGRTVRGSELRGHPEDLIESELFGHSKGSFAGAAERQDRKIPEGRRGGTLCSWSKWAI